MPSVTDNDTELFADDAKSYSEVVTEEDCIQLQKDLDSLVEWSDIWLLGFNTSKCICMHLGKNNPKHKYYIKNGDVLNELAESVCEKDLGVYVDNQLNFDSHISQVKEPTIFD